MSINVGEAGAKGLDELPHGLRAELLGLDAVALVPGGAAFLSVAWSGRREAALKGSPLP